MMKSWKGICFYLGFVWFCGAVLTNRSAFSQSSPWSLEDCISYARQNNLNVRRSYLKTLVQEEDYLQSRSQLLPEVGFNTGQNFSYTNKNGTGVYSGTYDLSASWSLTCGKLLNDISKRICPARLPKRIILQHRTRLCFPSFRRMWSAFTLVRL